MDGLSLYREIKKLRADTVAIVVTAYAGSVTAEEVQTAGVWQMLPKPVDFPGLLQLVNEALGQPLVMVVDDDHDLCASLWDVLREHGYRVCVAHDAPDAAARVKDGEFRVVLIDMRLSTGDGRTVFQAVRQANPHARTILITGFPSETERLVETLVTEGADAVCYKPFDMPNLLATLKKLAG
jgi:DNA-binding NtrC family response regulator